MTVLWLSAELGKAIINTDGIFTMIDVEKPHAVADSSPYELKRLLALDPNTKELKFDTLQREESWQLLLEFWRYHATTTLLLMYLDSALPVPLRRKAGQAAAKNLSASSIRMAVRSRLLMAPLPAEADVTHSPAIAELSDFVTEIIKLRPAVQTTAAAWEMSKRSVGLAHFAEVTLREFLADSGGFSALAEAAFYRDIARFSKWLEDNSGKPPIGLPQTESFVAALGRNLVRLMEENRKTLSEHGTGTRLVIPQRLTIHELGKLEGSIPGLSKVLVVASRIEDPTDELRRAVEQNLSKGVKYVFLVSHSTAANQRQGYFRIFETLREIVCYKNGWPPDALADSVTIARLPYEWGDCPYVFYQCRDDDDTISTIGFRGDELNEGIASNYVLLDDIAARNMALAVANGAPQTISETLNITADQFADSKLPAIKEPGSKMVN